ncbi:hypothetical protein ES705_39549 [subsurface metagenome]
MDCFREWNSTRAAAEFVRKGQRHGLFGRRWFRVVEFQGGVWPHYHLCVELTPEFAASLARAYRRKRGRGIIEINNRLLEPLWGRGFTCAMLSASPVRAALYAAGYSVSGGKERQRALPVWYDAWCKVTGKKRMHKWSFSRRFFDKENAVPKKFPRPRSEPPAQSARIVERTTTAILEGCGVRQTMVFIDVETVLVDDAGEIRDEGWSRIPLGKIDETVEDVVETLHRNAIAVDVHAGGEFSLRVDGLVLHAMRSLIPGKWFGWHHLKALGVNCNAREF